MLGYFISIDSTTKILLKREVDPGYMPSLRDYISEHIFHGSLSKRQNKPGIGRGSRDPLEVIRTGTFHPHMYLPDILELVVSETVMNLVSNLCNVSFSQVVFDKLFE